MKRCSFQLSNFDTPFFPFSPLLYLSSLTPHFFFPPPFFVFILLLPSQGVPLPRVFVWFVHHGRQSQPSNSGVDLPSRVGSQQRGHSHRNQSLHHRTRSRTYRWERQRSSRQHRGGRRGWEKISSSVVTPRYTEQLRKSANGYWVLGF